MLEIRFGIQHATIQFETPTDDIANKRQRIGMKTMDERRIAPAGGGVIDWQPISFICHSIVKRLLHLVLLIGAVMGLFDQGVAVASAFPCAQMSGMSVATAASTDCNMAAAADSKGKPPGKHMSLGCAGMIGCNSPVTIDAARRVSAGLPIKPIAATWPSPRRLLDRSIAPGQEPPAFLL